MRAYEPTPGKHVRHAEEAVRPAPGKHSLVDAFALGPDDYRWEDIPEAEFARDAQHADLGDEARMQHAPKREEEPIRHADDREERHDEAAHDPDELAKLPQQPTNVKGERLKIADPFILVDGAAWYAYGTGLTVRKSKDQGRTWTNKGKMTSFAQGGRRWAPEVHKIGDTYTAYISISKTETSRISIYVATSSDPVKGWSTPKPIAHAKQWNNIDATYFHDAKTGKSYLLWKEDRHSSKGRKTIVMQELDKTGTHLEGNKKKHTLLTAGVGANSELERRPAPRKPNWSVEAPTLEFHGGKYWLFYSGAGYERGGGYFVGAASASTITGPFHREPHPIVRGSKTMAEPGHQSIVKVAIGGKTRWLLFFHARRAQGNARYLREEEIVWRQGRPHVKSR